MKTIGRILHLIGNLWILICIGLFLFSAVKIYSTGTGAWDGLNKIWNVWNPFNVLNTVVSLLMLSPAFLFYKVGVRLQKKAELIHNQEE